MLTQEKLQEILWYCSATGEFYWKASPRRGRDGRLAGCVSDLGYWRIKIGKKYYRRGRLVWLYVHGTWPIEEVDHINRNRWDDRVSNLRQVTKAQNLQNKSPYRKKSDDNHNRSTPLLRRSNVA